MFPSDVTFRPRGEIVTNFLKVFWQDERGQDLVEYALAAGLVAVAAVAAMPALSTTVSAVFTKIGSIIESSVT
jgi:pilus assembly protein Flp/PilA